MVGTITTEGKTKTPAQSLCLGSYFKARCLAHFNVCRVMGKTHYCSEILIETLLPFIRHAFPDDHRFMQENDPKHTSILGRDTITENNINWWKTPPEIPDMNPIENMLHELKVNFRSRVKPRTKDELFKASVF